MTDFRRRVWHRRRRAPARRRASPVACRARLARRALPARDTPTATSWRTPPVTRCCLLPVWVTSGGVRHRPPGVARRGRRRLLGEVNSCLGGLVGRVRRGAVDRERPGWTRRGDAEAACPPLSTEPRVSVGHDDGRAWLTGRGRRSAAIATALLPWPSPTSGLASAHASDAVGLPVPCSTRGVRRPSRRSTPTASRSSAWCGARSTGTTYSSRPSRADGSASTSSGTRGRRCSSTSARGLRGSTRSGPRSPRRVVRS